MRVLITGGCGFIGSNLAQKCLDEGCDVVVVDDLSNGHRQFLPKRLQATSSVYLGSSTGFICGDFADGSILNLIKQRRFDVVFHLAALPRVGYSVDHPVESNDTNVSKTLELMAACRGNIKRFVFASSSSVYGGAINLPTSESEPKQPKSPYALQKSIIEDYLKLWCELYQFDSVSMRFFNVFGPNQLGNSPYATAISAWLTAIKQNKPMRSDGDGTQTRDMCYVDNVTDACFRAATHPCKLAGEVFNVACGESVSNNEILAYLLERFPTATKIDAPRRLGDVQHTLACVAKADFILGYTPIVTFWEGLERTIKWIEESDLAELKLNI